MKYPQPTTAKKAKAAIEPWILSVMIGTIGLTASVIFNFVECLKLALSGALQSFPHSLDQKYLVLIGRGFVVPIVWGFSARWLPAYLAIATPDGTKLRIALGLDLLGILCGTAGLSKVGTEFLAGSAVAIFYALHLAQRPHGKVKVQGIHSSFPSLSVWRTAGS